jgi:triphosphoribosyl-dephospho-CoA synthase
MKTDKEISQLAQMACVLEVCAPKPGNVNRSHDFSDCSLEDFILSAIAIGPAFENASRSGVGRIILQAATDTRRLVRSNTNLGMILLLAPLAKACVQAQQAGEIRQNLHVSLEKLDEEDARLAYAAIRHARPGGMGRVSEGDISEEPSITLLAAMIMAKDRDSIAREYATDFAITFDVGLPALKQALSIRTDYPDAIVQAFLTILSRVPDSLIARKRGIETARDVSARAENALQLGGVFTPEGRAALSAMDRDLRDPGHTLNPGTTADLTAAAIFLLLAELDEGAKIQPDHRGPP